MAFNDLDLLKIATGKRHDGYKVSVDHASDMAVHIYGAKPEKILNRVRPREGEDVKKYRLESYEPITTAKADKAITTVQKIMNPKLWSVKFPDLGKELEQYLFSNYPYYRNIMTYLNDVVIRAMIGDPNGVLIVIPLDMNITDLDKTTPIAECVKSESIHDYEFGKWFLIHRKKVKTDKGEVDYYHYIDGDKIIYFTLEFNKGTKQLTYSIISEYTHSIGEPPVWFLSGIITKLLNNGVLYRSYFSAAVPFWNKAISGDSDLDGAYTNHMHPIRVEVTEDCGFVMDDLRCNGGKITKNDGKQYDCPSCFGTGRKSVKSPYGVYLVPKPGLGEQAAPISPVSYVTVPTEPTAMLEERVQALLDQGLNALNMFFEVGENQSGIAKVLDRSELYDFLLVLSTVMFDIHLKNISYYSAKYLYMNKVEGKLPTINKPTSFDLLTSQEESVILKEGQQAGLDGTYIRAKMKNLIEKDLYGNQLERDMAIDGLLLNPLSNRTVDDVTNMLNAGLISDTSAIVYSNINAIIQQLYSENPSFNSLEYSKKVEAVEEVAKNLIKEPITPAQRDVA